MKSSSILTPDPKHRLRIGFDLFEFMEPSWSTRIKKGEASYIGPGDDGSLVVIDGRLIEAVMEAFAIRNSGQLEQFDQKRLWLEDGLLHLWKITPSIDQNRVTITIPKEIRALGLYPEAGSPLIVTVHGNRFELRPLQDMPEPMRWLKRAAGAIEEIRKLTDDQWHRFGVKMERSLDE